MSSDVTGDQAVPGSPVLMKLDQNVVIWRDVALSLSLKIQVVSKNVPILFSDGNRIFYFSLFYLKCHGTNMSGDHIRNNSSPWVTPGNVGANGGRWKILNWQRKYYILIINNQKLINHL